MREGIEFHPFVDKAINVAWACYWGYRLYRKVPLILAHGLTPMWVVVIIRFSLLGVLFLIRGPGRATRNPRAWLLAAILTMWVFLYEVEAPTGVTGPLATFCFMAMLAGLGWSVVGTFVLGRSFGALPAFRRLKLAGPYRVMRHPIYAGYIIHDAAFIYLLLSAHNLTVYLLFLVLIQWQAKFEEDVLASHDPAYADYCARVNWRFIPGLF